LRAGLPVAYIVGVARGVLIGMLALGWLLWLYNLARYRGLARTAHNLITQNTRLIETNESLRWQNSSLLAERTRRGLEDAARDRGEVIDLTVESEPEREPET
jgi:hypothetical protein